LATPERRAYSRSPIRDSSILRESRLRDSIKRESRIRELESSIKRSETAMKRSGVHGSASRIKRTLDYEEGLRGKSDLIDEIVLTLHDIIKFEKNLEKSKQDLALRTDFNLLDAFRLIDRLGKQSISSVELEDFLNELGLRTTIKEIYLLMRRFDTDNDGKLRFSDFAEALSPKQKDYLELLTRREAVNAELQYRLRELFSSETII